MTNVSGCLSAVQLLFIIILWTVLELADITECTAAVPTSYEAGNLVDKPLDDQTSSYKNVGCFKDTETRAVPLLEGSDPELAGFYKSRQNAVEKCANAARKRGYQVFAIQNGGMCLSGPEAHNNYKMHGPERDCKDGKGGQWSNDVYVFNDFPLKVSVFTGNLAEAGTDANVHITFSGSLGSTRRNILDSSTQQKLHAAAHGGIRNLFEAGQKDVFNVHTVPFGSLKKITIGHDNSGSMAGWYLEKVIVKDPGNTLYKFKVNRWLANNEDDGRLEREISATQTITPGRYKHFGCFKERPSSKNDRAVPSLEGQDDMLDGQGEPAYKRREFPVEKCADVTRRHGYVMFAIQDGGLCASGKEMQNTYAKYGRSEECGSDGTGSSFASDIYVFADRESEFNDVKDVASIVTKDQSTSQRVLSINPALQPLKVVAMPTSTTRNNTTTTIPSATETTGIAGTTGATGFTGTKGTSGANVQTESSSTGSNIGTGASAQSPSVSGNIQSTNDVNFEAIVLALAEKYREIKEADMRQKEGMNAGNAKNANPATANLVNSNTENTNSGNANSGTVNTGNTNPGNANSGTVNTGNTNPGNANSGTVNTGNTNPGISNARNTNTTNVTPVTSSADKAIRKSLNT